MAAGVPHGGPVDGWDAVLSRLESSVARTERLLEVAENGTSGYDDRADAHWQPPADLGPLPAHLVERALSLRARQEAVDQAVRSALLRTGQHRRLTDRVDAATSAPTAPAYLDLRA